MKCMFYTLLSHLSLSIICTTFCSFCTIFCSLAQFFVHRNNAIHTTTSSVAATAGIWKDHTEIADRYSRLSPELQSALEPLISTPIPPLPPAIYVRKFLGPIVVPHRKEQAPDGPVGKAGQRVDQWYASRVEYMFSCRRSLPKCLGISAGPRTPSAQ